MAHRQRSVMASGNIVAESVMAAAAGVSENDISESGSMRISMASNNNQRNIMRSIARQWRHGCSNNNGSMKRGVISSEK